MQLRIHNLLIEYNMSFFLNIRVIQWISYPKPVFSKRMTQRMYRNIFMNPNFL